MWLAAGGAIVAAWAWRLFGGHAALLATIAWCTEPNLLAHGSLITPDVGMTSLWVATLWLAHRYTQTPSTRIAALTGLTLGLAQLSKYTAILLFPALSVAAVGWWVLDRSASRPSGIRALRDAAVAGLAAVVVWNSGYLFRGTFATWGDAPARSQSMQRVLSNWPVLRSIPSPIPLGYLHGLDAQSMAVESQHPIYLDGDWSQTGFPAYFFWAILYKLPVLWLVGAAITAVCWTREARAGSVARWLWLAGPSALLLAVASTTPMQLGIRYVLPILPCAAVLCSRWGNSLLVFRSLPQRVALMLVLIAACIGLREHPHHLTYFQEVTGDVTASGWPRLLDSNWDWGQDLHLAAAEIKKRGWDSGPVYLAYFGTVPPAALGLTQYELPLHGTVVPGRYVCSVNFVFGRPNVVTAADGTQHPLAIFQLGFLQFIPPLATAGRSIWLYEITPGDVMRIRALVEQSRQ
jgi:4-amino-4-deoxy-L-arabinose transferase-like glycosyltransferase